MQAKEGASGNTPLHQAAWYNGVDAAKVLVDYGADWNIKNNDGDTPLAVAQKSANNTGKVAEFLKEVSNGKYKPALHKIPVKQYNMGISNWAKAPVENLKLYNIIPTSLSNENLSRKSITREEVTELLMSLQRIIDKEIVKSISNNPFKDVENPQVLEAYELGIISGISSDEFHPSGNLTREQMITMIVKLLEKNGIDIKVKSESLPIVLKDFNQTSFWAKEYMVFALNNGIIRGLSDNKIEPQGLLTREQALVIVNTVAIKYGFIENKVSTTL